MFTQPLAIFGRTAFPEVENFMRVAEEGARVAWRRPRPGDDPRIRVRPGPLADRATVAASGQARALGRGAGLDGSAGIALSEG